MEEVKDQGLHVIALKNKIIGRQIFPIFLSEKGSFFWLGKNGKDGSNDLRSWDFDCSMLMGLMIKFRSVEHESTHMKLF